MPEGISTLQEFSDNQFRAVFRSPEVLLNIIITEHNIPLNWLMQNVTQDWQGFIYLTPAVTSMGSFKGQNGRTTDQHACLRPAAFVVLLLLHSSGTKTSESDGGKSGMKKKTFPICHVTKQRIRGPGCSSSINFSSRVWRSHLSPHRANCDGGKPERFNSLSGKGE